VRKSFHAQGLILGTFLWLLS